MRWCDKSGWDVLFGLAGGVPGLYPYFLTADFTLPQRLFGQPPVTQTRSVVVSADSEFWIFGANSGGWSTFGPTQPEGLGSVPTESPDCFPATVLVREGTAGRTLSAGPVNLGHIFGGGPRPYLWPCPWKVLPGTDLQVTVSNRGNLPQRVLLTFIGFKRFCGSPAIPTDVLLTPQLVRVLSKYRASGRDLVPTPYFYGMTFAGDEGRAPKATETQTVAITEADFALCHLAGAVDDPESSTSWLMANTIDNNAHESTATPPVPANGVAQETIRLITGLGQTRLDDRPVLLGNLFGTGRKIGRYPSPLVIPRNDSITAVLNFQDAGGGLRPLRADLTFGGARLVEP